MTLISQRFGIGRLDRDNNQMHKVRELRRSVANAREPTW
jgi:hypothetical protein